MPGYQPEIVDRIQKTAIRVVQLEAYGVVVDLFEVGIYGRAVLFLPFDEYIPGCGVDVLVTDDIVGEDKIVSVERLTIGPAHTAP